MLEINSEATLRDAILLLEFRRSQEEKALREEFRFACDSLKPANLIKSSFKEAISSRGLEGTIVSTSAGLAAGYLSKLLFVNVSHSPLRKILGFAVQFGMAKLVANHPGLVKSVGTGILNFIRHRQVEKKNEG